MKSSSRAAWRTWVWAIAMGWLGPWHAAVAAVEPFENPASVVFNNRYYVAHRSDDPSHKLVVQSSANGIDFKTPGRTYAIPLGSNPAMAVFNNQLYVAYRSDDPSHRLGLTTSGNGATFSMPVRIYDGLRLGSSPAMAVFNNQLFIAYQSDDPSHRLVVTSTVDGVNFFSPRVKPAPGYRVGELARTYDIRLGSDPVMAVRGHRLLIGYWSDEPDHRFLVTSSADGVHFSSAAPLHERVPIG